jgi:hypothetical protein
MVSSIPGDFNDCQFVGLVLGVHVVRQHITGILLRIKVTDDDPCVIAIVPMHPLPKDFTQRGDRVWVRGRLASDPAPEKKALHYVEAVHIDVVKRANSTAMMAGKGGAS